MHTKNRGLLLEPNHLISNAKIDYFKIKGRVDSNYATNLETRKSITGVEVILSRALVVMRSIGQRIVALSITEAKLISKAQVTQEMLYMIRIVELIGLKVKKSIILECNNKGSIDICNS